MQAEAGGLAEHEFSVDVELAGGELDVVAEGLAEVFFAVEGQDVEGASTSRTQSVWRLWSKKTGNTGCMLQTSLVYRCRRGGFVAARVQALDSFQEGKKG